MATTLLVLSTLTMPAVAACPATLDFELRTLAGQEKVRLCQRYQGKVVLVVNTASKCGFTYQYEGLEALYENYRERGFVVIGFPSNDFGGQEPGTEKEIQRFCRLTYSIRFPMFEKIHVRQEKPHPLYQKLATLAGEYPAWNFHKYLLGRDGSLVASYPSDIEPSSPQLVHAIEKELRETAQ
ncbi:MAG: glutathione peroxidase [Acidiferrobacterales bacterium]|nr:glutathione peroxidase [Acidiferrobacterales bacterium]